jgi:hypothetical protein
MFSSRWEVGGVAWVWRRQLWVWEKEMLRECQILLHTGYYVRGVYKLLTSKNSITLGEAEDLMWNKHVPLRVSIFVWRLLRNRLPTKTNLVTQGILHKLTYVCQDVAASNQLNTYSFFVVLLVPFGRGVSGSDKSN